jgi:translation initiation factor 3 subunit I
VKYNADGDLLFTASKDSKPNVWYSETGERLGTYGKSLIESLLSLNNKPVHSIDNHKGAVWDLDPSWDSKYLVTGCGDANARLFELTTGKIIARMPHKGSVRAVTWGEGTHFFATASDPFTSRDLGTISIFEFPSESDIGSGKKTRLCIWFSFDESMLAGTARSDDSEPLHVPTREIYVDDMTKVMCLAYTIVNQHIIAGFDNGTVVKYDSETGQEVMRKSLHHDRINRINFNRDKSLFITASSDKDAKLVDPVSLEVLKVYRTPAPVNGAVISPTHPHVLIGGGQDAMKVTVTSGSQGKFETRLFHMLYEEEFGRVKGHFGPINALAIHPYGKSYASGAEDG